MRPGLAPDASIFLVGFMGSGKTSVGRALAARLGRPFADTDALVEGRCGCTVETIFRERGEGRFREVEWDVLNDVAREGGSVVATGGGLFLGVAQRAMVRAHGASVWLDATFPVVASRLGDDALRPLWARADDLDRRAMFERRRAAYALADLSVDADEGDADTVASRVESRWRSLFR